MSRLFANVKNDHKIELPEIGIWIKVRDELSIGEERKVFAGAIKGQTQLQDGDTRTEYDAERISFGLVVGYLTDWNATDEEGKSVDLTPDAIRGLLPDVYKVVEDAVNAHVEAVRAKKKTPAKKAKGEAISLSVAGSTAGR